MNYSRTCKVCNITKHLSDFSKNPQCSLGHAKVCKDCKNRLCRENRNPSMIARHKDNERFGGNRIKALTRDKYTCQRCGMVDEAHKKIYGRGITVDHIDGKGRNASVKNNSLDNLITLCLSCHAYKEWKMRKACK